MSNERLVVPGLFPPPAYSHVARATNGVTVYTAGAVPLDATGALVGAGDYERQARCVIENLERALAAAGAGPADLVKTTVYVVATDPGPLSEVWEVVRSSSLAGAPSTLLGVSVLGYTGQLVEIEAIAAA